MKEKNGFTSEYNFYVGVITNDGEFRYVTSIDYASKTSMWEKDKPALKMTKNQAIQLQMGLICNMRTALVIEVPDFCDELMKN